MKPMPARVTRASNLGPQSETPARGRHEAKRDTEDDEQDREQHNSASGETFLVADREVGPITSIDSAPERDAVSAPAGHPRDEPGLPQGGEVTTL
jgi:hypothetical protein